MATKKKVQKKAVGKKVNSKVVAPTNDLFVEMSSPEAVDPSVQAEYNWRAYTPEEFPASVFVTGLIGGAMLGAISALAVLLLARLFS